MLNRLSSNEPNICGSCAEADWDEESPLEPRALVQVPSPFKAEILDVECEHSITELQWHPHCLGLPTAIDLIEAEIAAKKLIAETAAQEARFLERKLCFLTQPAPNN
jgi:hypothetical protein